MPPYLSEAKTCFNQRCFVKSKAANTEHQSYRAGSELLLLKIQNTGWDLGVKGLKTTSDTNSVINLLSNFLIKNLKI